MLTPLTPEEEQAHRIALQIVFEIEQGGHRAGKVSALDEQLARALLSVKGKLESAEKQNQRERDLIRYQRMELFTADLITESEYSELAQEHSAVKRLEDYDSLRAELTEARNMIQYTGIWTELASELWVLLFPGTKPSVDTVAEREDSAARIQQAVTEARKAPQPTQEQK